MTCQLPQPYVAEVAGAEDQAESLLLTEPGPRNVLQCFKNSFLPCLSGALAMRENLLVDQSVCQGSEALSLCLIMP